jgi:hypothetical protein
MWNQFLSIHLYISQSYHLICYVWRFEVNRAIRSDRGHGRGVDRQCGWLGIGMQAYLSRSAWGRQVALGLSAAHSVQS